MILVSRGTYHENINFNGKNITIKSVAGPEHTAIDGGMRDAVVKFRNGETRRAVLDGFTLTNGSAWEVGRVSIGNSGPTIRNNIIKKNLGKTTGGVFCGGGIRRSS